MLGSRLQRPDGVTRDATERIGLLVDRRLATGLVGGVASRRAGADRIVRSVLLAVARGSDRNRVDDVLIVGMRTAVGDRDDAFVRDTPSRPEALLLGDVGEV